MGTRPAPMSRAAEWVTMARSVMTFGDSPNLAREGAGMRVLVTGFEPFDGATVNTSWQAVEELTRRGVPGLELVALRLPVEFGRAADLLCAELETYREPDAVVCLGEAAGRRAVTPERVAINL